MTCTFRHRDAHATYLASLPLQVFLPVGKHPCVRACIVLQVNCMQHAMLWHAMPFLPGNLYATSLCTRVQVYTRMRALGSPVGSCL